MHAFWIWPRSRTLLVARMRRLSGVPRDAAGATAAEVRGVKLLINGPRHWPVEFLQLLMMPFTMAASASSVKGFAMICMPSSIRPFPTAAPSA